MTKDIIEQIEADQVRQDIPDFGAGDTVVVQVKGYGRYPA